MPCRSRYSRARPTSPCGPAKPSPSRPAAGEEPRGHIQYHWRRPPFRSPRIATQPDRKQRAERIIDCRGEFRSIAQHLRVIWLVEKQPAPDENPFQRGGIAAVEQPFHRPFWQQVNRRFTVAVLNEAAADGH